MLKIVNAANNFGYNHSKSKCAEIHYQSSTFSILCIFCGLKTLAFSEFCEHFKKHCEEFTDELSDTEVLIINIENNSTTNSNCKHDPLKLEAADISNDSDVGLNILGTSNQGTINKIENKNDESLSVNQLFRHKPVFVGLQYDKNIVKNKIKEEVTGVYTKSTKTNLVDCSTYKRTSGHENTSESESDQTDSNHTESKAKECIDWTKSYEPNLLKNSDKRPYKARNTPNMCTYCGKTFRRRLQLDTHLNIHTGSKPHQCEICGRQFRAVTTLARHRNTHQNRSDFCCKFCSKSFSRRAAMLSHELRHTQERRVPCDKCEKLFYTVNQMDTHKRKLHHMTDDASLPFQCNLCTNRYRSASMLSTHKLKKHYKTAKIFCEQCDKKFIDEAQLEVHKTIHKPTLKHNSYQIDTFSK
uniref:Zinc finger protein 90 n=1 Tax=Bactrocera latifrons TaxID=174628 RepID=A0A0K8U1G1_BACLA